ncbi:M13 family metallopeptidase [[Mycoplasma] collis]|uniref:M13 family metallopeptidase n=1 Tax=[Mycoplasma] collis TaxID=2127 RepID=UPI00051C7D99|nr:M13 family metallopeptidase [[Mycoplasma] collis]
MINKIKNDFFAAINEKWLKKSKIPNDKSSISAFVENSLKIKKLTRKLLKKWSKDASTIPNYPHLHECVKFYNLILNEQKRDELGWEPIRETLDSINEIKSFSEIIDNWNYFNKKYVYLPWKISIYADFKNGGKNIAWISDQDTILDSTKMYEDPEVRDKSLKVWSKMVQSLLIDYGMEKNKANALIKKALKFDNLYKDYVLSPEQLANFVSFYNIKSRSELKKMSKKHNILKSLDLTFGKAVSKISVQNPKNLASIDVIFSEKNFENYKALFFINNLLSRANFLSEKIRNLAFKYAKFAYSIKKIEKLEDYAVSLTSQFFGMPFGLFYGKRYFGQKAKKNVENMVQSIITEYQIKLKNNSWLSKETINTAIKKLSKLRVMIGFPSKIEPFYKEFKIDDYSEGGNLVNNIEKLNRIYYDYKFSLYNQKENDKYWKMKPTEINAYYDPIKNLMVFPAGILRAPFYDLKRNSSANFAGIGSIIAHEISHGFDNNGANFDEDGNLNNWWTEKDYEEFKNKTNAVIELYDGAETEFGNVNGKLTVSENIADISGFSCSLNAAQKEKDFDAKIFFESWAEIWRSKYTENAAKRRLETDVHSPAKIRVNIVVANEELFYKTFNIDKNDKMYIDPKKRIKIW